MPYYTNDNWVYYDLNAHRYVLKPEYMRDNYSVDLINSLDLSGSGTTAQSAVQNLLKRASRVIYNYIYSHHPGNVEYTTYRIVKDPKYKNTIVEAMGELVYSWLINNNDLSIQNGISVDLGKLYDRIDSMKNQVPVIVEEILYSGDIITRMKWPFDSEYEADKITKGISW